MLTKEEISSTLPQFSSTENYHRWSVLFRNVVMTDGAKFIAESCEAFWLMDVIGSHLPKLRGEEFIKVWAHRVKGKFVVQFEDGNDHVLKKQTIEFTDFPLDQIVLYCCPQGDQFVIMLPSEW